MKNLYDVAKVSNSNVECLNDDIYVRKELSDTLH